MKKVVFIVLLVSIFLLNGYSATTGSVTITGTVAPQLNITVPANYTGAINDGVSETTIWAVGDVTVTSNYKNWTISVSSGNSGNLVHSVDNTEVIPYTFTLGSLVTNQSLSTAWTSSAQTRTPKVGRTYALSIKFVSSDTTFWETGDYSDTLTLTIAHP